MKDLLFAVVVATLLCQAPAAQDFFVGNSTNDNVFKLSDTDSDGAYQTPGEITQFLGIRSAAVHVIGFNFDPAVLSVPQGTRVTWVNSNSSNHDVSSISGPASFGSGTMLPGESFTMQFDLVGTYDYGCAIHPSMTGQLVVTASSPAPYDQLSPRGMAWRMEGTQPTFYWVDTVGDFMGRAQDLNGDGQLTDDEWTPVFYDMGSASPDGIDFHPDGSVWYTSDGSSSNGNTGLTRLEDLNGDGDAEDAGESVTVLTPASGVTIPTLSGVPWSPSVDDIEHLRWIGGSDPGGWFVTYEHDDSVFYGFRDTDGDGAVLTPGETILWLNATGVATDAAGVPLDANPDFGPVLPLLQYWNTAGTSIYGAWTSNLEVDETTGDAYFATVASAGTLNLNSQDISGLVFRARDLNGDDDVNDAGEVTLFYDGAGAAYIQKTLDLAWWGGSLYLLDVGTSDMVIHRFTDIDGNGDAMGPGEATTAWDKTPMTYPFEVDFCYSYDMTATDPGAFGPGGGGSTASFTNYGSGCPGTGGFTPVAGQNNGPPSIGNSAWEAALTNSVGGTVATLMIGASDTLLGGAPLLPLDLALIGIPGCTLLQSMQATVAVPVFGAGAGAGTASVNLPIPGDAWLDGVEIYLQWFVVDPGAGNPFFVTFSDGGHVTIG